jgi:hypothetical protein
MTDVIDRGVGQVAVESPPSAVELTSDAPAHDPERGLRATTAGTVLRGCIAVLLVGAGAIHFGMMGEHAGVSWSHGLFFALVAFAQLGLAVLVVTRRTRPVLLGVIAVNLAVLGVWIVSRTAGIAIGGDGTPEQWGWIDGLCAGFEIAAVLGSVVLLRPSWARRPLSRGVGQGAVAFIGILVIALTAWVFSPSVGAGDGTSADGHNHGSGASAAGGGGHSHAAPVDDKGLSALSNGHHHVMGPEQPLDAATRAQLSHEMDVTIEVARQYPTVAAAEAGGYRRVGGYMPGIGAHYITFGGAAFNPDGTMDDADLRRPLSIIYDGTNPDSKVAGFMYYSMSPKEPAGFAGPNDVWHYHESLCLKYGPGGQIDVPFGLDRSATPKQCASVGGEIMKLTQWMVHVWSVPGWESRQGLFGEVNPALACPDGTYYQRPPREWAAHPLNTCKSAV